MHDDANFRQSLGQWLGIMYMSRILEAAGASKTQDSNYSHLYTLTTPMRLMGSEFPTPIAASMADRGRRPAAQATAPLATQPRTKTEERAGSPIVTESRIPPHIPCAGESKQAHRYTSFIHSPQINNLAGGRTTITHNNNTVGGEAGYGRIWQHECKPSSPLNFRRATGAVEAEAQRNGLAHGILHLGHYKDSNTAQGSQRASYGVVFAHDYGLFWHGPDKGHQSAKQCHTNWLNLAE